MRFHVPRHFVEPAEPESAAPVPPARPTVLAITPFYMDQIALRIASVRRRWDLLICPTLEGALRIRGKRKVTVIVYDFEGRDPDWRYGVRKLITTGNPACLIGLTTAPSDALWRKAIEYGAFDVQRKPLRKNPLLAKSVDAAGALMGTL